MRARILILLLCAVAAGWACGEGGGIASDPAAAEVEGKEIEAKQLDAELDEFTESAAYREAAKTQDAEELQRQFQQASLSRKIRIEVFESQADEIGVEITEADLDDRLGQIKAQFESEEAFQARVAQEGLTEEAVDELVYLGLLEERLRAEVTKGLGPTQAEISAYYEKNKARFLESFQAAHIVVEDKARAGQISKQLRGAPPAKVPALFERLAKQFSTDKQSAARGGELGTRRPGELVPEFDATVAELDEGDISGPVQSQFGYHVIRLIDKQTAALESVAPQIEQQLAGEGEAGDRWTEWVEDAYRTSEIEVNPRYGEFDLKTQQVVNAGPESIPGAEETSPTPTESPTGD
jgi:foldase protein PrsA